MNKIAILLLFLAIMACNRPQDRIQVVEDKNLTQKQIDSVLNEYNFEYSRVVFIDSTEQLILPISTQKPRGGSRYSKESYEADSYPQFWNLVFYNAQNAETRLLTKEKFRISEFKTNLSYGGFILQKSVLYKIGAIDYNQDGKLTYADPEQLYISDTNGENLRILSPAREDIAEYQIIPNSDKIIFKTRRDTNDDLKFDKRDEIIWYLIDLSKESKPVEILNDKERKEVETLYFEQWLIKNNKA